MTFSQSPGAVKQFRDTPWSFQQTFSTPLQNLDSFVATILSADERIAAGTITIAEVVCEPKDLKSLPLAHTIVPAFQRDCSFSAASRRETHDLLRAALTNWVDFIFVPVPKPFVLFAGHDQFTTFFADSQSDLNLVTHKLLAAGFTPIENWARKF